MLLAVVNQALFVNPNPLDQERAFIANDIAATRLAYGLDDWTSRPYPATNILTAEALVDDADTFVNARLWDYRPLGATLDQLQTVRQYYDFVDVDIDRYIIDGKQRQVMLSGREMALDRNPTVNNWLNAHFVYTHGYGVAMVPVNAVQPDGLPDLIVRDLPVVSEPGAPVITEPRIYFGERPAPWVVTGAQTDEFDYPANDAGSDATTRWTGTTGIDISDGINRLLLSIWTGDFVSLLTSPQITDESQFLMRRTLDERLGALAPFLAWDGDPYLVITESGRLVWIIDAYTTTDRFPQSRVFDGVAGGGSGVNVPVGHVQLPAQLGQGGRGRLRRHDHDVHQRPHRSAHRDLGRGLSDACSRRSRSCLHDLWPHLRYPEGLFNVQTGMFEAYHVTDPTTFYQGDNLWTVPGGAQGQGQALPGEAYYVQMRLPGEDETEYLLIQPMVPGTPAEHDRVGGGAQRCRQPRRGARTTSCPRTPRSSGRPRSRRASTRHPRSAPRSRSGTSPGRASSGATSSWCRSAARSCTSSPSISRAPRPRSRSSPRSWSRRRRRWSGPTPSSEALRRAVGEGTPSLPTPGPDSPGPTPTPRPVGHATSRGWRHARPTSTASSRTPTSTSGWPRRPSARATT